MKLTKKELLDLEKNLELMQTVTFKKGVDKKSDYNKFKLVAGKNFSAVHELGQDLAKQMAESLDMSEYDDFVREASEAIEREAPAKEVEAIKKKYKDVIDKMHETNLVLDKMLDEVVELELEKYPLEKIPANISGSFLNSIKDMLTY